MGQSWFKSSNKVKPDNKADNNKHFTNTNSKNGTNNQSEVRDHQNNTNPNISCCDFCNRNKGNLRCSRCRQAYDYSPDDNDRVIENQTTSFSNQRIELEKPLNWVNINQDLNNITI